VHGVQVAQRDPGAWVADNDDKKTMRLQAGDRFNDLEKVTKAPGRPQPLPVQVAGTIRSLMAFGIDGFTFLGSDRLLGSFGLRGR